jgi:hypothetical protein
MKSLSRRSVTAGLAAAATAIPAVGLHVGAKRDPASDPLLEAIHRFNAEIAAINASGDIGDEATDAWVARAGEIMEEAVGLPVLTTASAMAVIDLYLADELLTQHSVYGDELRELIRAARNHIALTVQA